jgi:hypothetical protein
MPKQCKILIGDRNYLTWFFNDIDANIDIRFDENEELRKIQPLEQKMFSGM